MAEAVITNQYVLLNSVDLSTRLIGTDFADIVEAQEASRMGTTSRISLPGLIGHTLRMRFLQDYAASGAGSVDATVSAIVSARSQVAIAWRPVNTTIGTTNPEYQATVSVSNYMRAAGRVGETDVAEVEFMFCSAVVRDTSP